MGYLNPIVAYGPERFCIDAAAAGVDGLIAVDLPPEEADMLAPFAAAEGVDIIRLVAPTTDEARLPYVLEGSSGFLYYVAITGITGTRSASGADLLANIPRLRRFSDLPIAIGFGVRTPAQAAEAASIGDAAVVASALIETLAKSLDAEGAPGLPPWGWCWIRYDRWPPPCAAFARRRSFGPLVTAKPAVSRVVAGTHPVMPATTHVVMPAKAGILFIHRRVATGTGTTHFVMPAKAGILFLRRMVAIGAGTTTSSCPRKRASSSSTAVSPPAPAPPTSSCPRKRASSSSAWSPSAPKKMPAFAGMTTTIAGMTTTFAGMMTTLAAATKTFSSITTTFPPSLGDRL